MARLTVERAQAQYHDFNIRYFGGELPDVDIEIVSDLRMNVGKRYRLLGATSKTDALFTIELVQGMPKSLQKITLAHEMVHVKLWPQSGHRSKAWRAEVNRLAGMGFLLEVF